MEEKRIPRAVIERLPRYYRFLGELKEEGVERISSGDLSRRMHVTASQIRQDLNRFGGFGLQGYGYSVPSLHETIGEILGVGHLHEMIIIGAGHLGQALANYQNFEKRGFKVIALFDKNEQLVGTTLNRGIPILPMDQLEEFVTSHSIRLATMAIPKFAAPEVAEKLVACGVTAIWNFAHTDLEVPEGVVVENVHLSESLMRLSYRMKKGHEADVEDEE